jgi:hypothetical protein
MSSICFHRGLFPPECFKQKRLSGIQVQHLTPKIRDKATKQPIVINEEAVLVSQWLEEGVFEALQHRYLRQLAFCITDFDDQVLESYRFEFKYPDSESFQMNDEPITQEQLKRQSQKVLAVSAPSGDPSTGAAAMFAAPQSPRPRPWA